MSSKLLIPGLRPKPREEKSTSLERPDSLSFSPSGKYLFFNYNGEYLFIFDYDKQRLINTPLIGMNAGTGGRMISPNEQYAVVDTGSGPGDRGRTLITTSGVIIDRFYGTNFFWKEDSSGFIMSSGECTLTILPYGPEPSNQSVYIYDINGQDVTKKPFLESSYQQSFRLISLENGKLRYKKEYYAEPFPKDSQEAELMNKADYQYWEKIYNNPDVSYWEMDLTTGESIEVEAPPEKEIGTAEWGVSYSPSRNWKVYTKGDWPNRQIFVAKADGSEEQRVAPGDEVTWRPGK